MIHVERVVGRLIEVRTVSPFTVDELTQFGGQLGQILRDIKGRIIPCTDLRGATVATPEQSDTLIGLFRRDNPLVERSAILVGGGQATLGMQVERLVREAANPARKTFREVEPLYAYLDEVLTIEERARLRVFLEPDAARPSSRSPMSR